MSNHKSVIVLIEDDIRIRHFVSAALESQQWQVHQADTAKRGLVEAGTRRPDLIIVDLGLPDRDGVDLIHELRTWSSLPVLVLSARAAQSDKIAALDAGADDYLAKPFGTGELLARVRAMLRRRLNGPLSAQATVEFGGIHVDLALRTVVRSGETLRLTPIEYRLLSYLIANTGKVLTHRQLLCDVWGQAQAQNNPSLRVFMAQLRQKIEEQPSQPKHLLTEIGVGYRFVL